MDYVIWIYQTKGTFKKPNRYASLKYNTYVNII